MTNKLKKNYAKIAVVYSHHKLGDLIWQLPYIKSISNHHNTKVALVTRPKTQAKQILSSEDYLYKVYYCSFRKKIWYFYEIFKLFLFFKKNKFTHIYLLDKISRPAIAAKLSGIKFIIGPGIGSQKRWLSNKNFLTNEDYNNLDYSEQSEKLLKINGIKTLNKIPSINLNEKILSKIKLDFSIANDDSGELAVFGVDSFEEYKMWFEDQFAELANLLHNKKIIRKIFLITSRDNKAIIKRIKKLSGKDIFYDCSDLNLVELIKVIKMSKFFVGNNSGPLNLASALKVKSFGLIANDRVSELKNSNILPILPDDYKNEFNRDRHGMRKLTVEKVFNFIKKFYL